MNLFGAPNIERMAAERDYDGLYKCLEHRDRLVRLQAAQALAEMQDGAGWRFLMEKVTDENDPDSQIVAAAILGELGHTRAVPELRDALKKARTARPANEDLLEVLREALEMIGGQQAEEALRAAGYQTEVNIGTNLTTLGSSLGSTDYLAGDTPPAITSMDEIQFLSAEEHLNLAVELRESEQAEWGLVECSLALWLKPDFAYAWYLRGVLMEDREREYEALLAYRRAVEIDPSLTDARDALADLEESIVPLPLDRAVLLTELNGSWQERRNAAAAFGEMAGDPSIDDIVVNALIDHLEDEEREVRHAAIEALTEIGAHSPELARPALRPLLDHRESSWLLRFALVEAISAIGSAESVLEQLRAELDRLQSRNPALTRRVDPMLEVEYGRFLEIGVLALERTGDLPGLLAQAEANVWVEEEEEEEETGWAEDEGTDELIEEALLEEVDEYEVTYSEDDEAAGEDELASYVDEVGQIAAYALERVAIPAMPQLDVNTLVRLAQVPDLTLIDLSGEEESPEPVVVHDLSKVRLAAREALHRKGIA